MNAPPLQTRPVPPRPHWTETYRVPSENVAGQEISEDRFWLPANHGTSAEERHRNGQEALEWVLWFVAAAFACVSRCVQLTRSWFRPD